MMHTQTLTPAKNESIYIATPAGVIELLKLPHKHWEIRLPGDLRAFKDRDRAIAESDFLTKSGTGGLIPSYTLLVPDVDEHGNLRGVKKVDSRAPLRLRTQGAKNDTGKRPADRELETVAAAARG